MHERGDADQFLALLPLDGVPVVPDPDGVEAEVVAEPVRRGELDPAEIMEEGLSVVEGLVVQ
jgi:hypothetical protein